jgi:hypothetical protein
VSIARLEVDEQITGKWVVRLETPYGTGRAVLDTFELASLGVKGMPASVTTWRQFVRSLADDGFAWTAPVLREIGVRLANALLGAGDVGRKWTMLRTNGGAHVEISVVGDASSALHDLPIELACEGLRFVFKDREYPSRRVLTNLRHRGGTVGAGATILVATAHDDARPPSAEQFDAHAQVIEKHAQRLALRVRSLRGAATDTLREALTQSAEPGVPAVLYLACHGMTAPDDDGGALRLRGGDLPASKLAELLREARERDPTGRGVEWVILCACSSAAATGEPGTTSIAEWAVQDGDAVVALGFRGDIDSSYALNFTESVFAHLDGAYRLDDAVARARQATSDGNGQWILPVLYARPSGSGLATKDLVATPFDLDVPQHRHFVSSPQHREVMGWLDQPSGSPMLTLKGQPGLGKSELARAVALTVESRGEPVVWMDRPDRDVTKAQLTMLRSVRPSWQLANNTTDEDVTEAFRASMATRKGLIVLDDVADEREVRQLLPGPGWKVLLTTSKSDLLPETRRIEVAALPLESRLVLLSRIAWGKDRPPARERSATQALVGRLADQPTALKLAGATLRAGATPKALLAALEARHGDASPIPISVVLAHVMDAMTPLARLTMKELSTIGAAGAKARALARRVSNSDLDVKRTLDSLERRQLVTFQSRSGKFIVEESVRALISP